MLKLCPYTRRKEIGMNAAGEKVGVFQRKYMKGLTEQLDKLTKCNSLSDRVDTPQGEFPEGPRTSVFYLIYLSCKFFSPL